MSSWHLTTLGAFSWVRMRQVVFLIALSATSLFCSPESRTEPEQADLAKILRARSKETGEKFVLTRKAAAVEDDITTRALLNSRFKSTVLSGWTVLHLSNEDLSAVEKRARKNEGVWASAIANFRDRRPMNFGFSGAAVGAVKMLIWRTCGVRLEFNSSRRALLSFVNARGMPAEDFCQDYMLILAANDIVVRELDGRWTAELDEANGDSSSQGRKSVK